MDSFLSYEISIIEVLIVVSIVAIIAQRWKLPYTVALVVAGLAVAFQGQLHLEFEPDLVLALIVPPLLFEAALHLELNKLRTDLLPIIVMAVPGVLLSTFIVGGLLAVTGVLPLAVALLFGALISATDPVAVIATFRAVGVPKRLSMLVEGESLFNDGTAIVLFNVMRTLALVSLGIAAEGHFSLTGALLEFVIEVAGGLLVGGVLGYIVSKVIARIDDYLIETTLTTILTYGSYLLAANMSIAGFHFSGVLAVVAAGLINGNLGPQGMSPTTRIVLFNFWEYIAFLANSFIFILIGMNVEWDLLVRFSGGAFLAVIAVLTARAINVYLLGGLVRLWKSDLPFHYFHILFWGGLRGAISLALVYSLPLAMGEQRNELLAMTFAVVLFTLLIQATSIPELLRRLGLTESTGSPAAYERLQGRLLATRAATRHLDRLYNEGALIPLAWEQVRGELDEREQALSIATRDLLTQQPELGTQVVSLARVEALRAQRAALDDLAQEELLSGDILAELKAEIDEAINSPNGRLLPLQGITKAQE